MLDRPSYSIRAYLNIRINTAFGFPPYDIYGDLPVNDFFIIVRFLRQTKREYGGEGRKKQTS